MAEYYAAGERDFGLLLGMQDAIKEEVLMRTKEQDMVREFHEAFGLPIAVGLGIPKPSNATRKLRVELLREEFEDEYLAAEDNDDIVEIADALGDILYIAYGTALTYGIDLHAVFAEIHRSNMSKLGADGKPIRRDDGKVLKGPSYERPNIAKVLGLER